MDEGEQLVETWRLDKYAVEFIGVDETRYVSHSSFSWHMLISIMQSAFLQRRRDPRDRDARTRTVARDSQVPPGRRSERRGAIVRACSSSPHPDVSLISYGQLWLFNPDVDITWGTADFDSPKGEAVNKVQSGKFVTVLWQDLKQYVIDLS
jgi:hypothetical protein